jgi:hypothetical protein
MTRTRTIGGAIGAAVGVVLAVGGGALIAVDDHQRDRDGYFSTKTTDVRANGYAITSTDLGIDGVDGDLTRALTGRLRVRVSPAAGSPVFVGVGRTNDVDRYLRDVARSEVTDFDDDEASLRVKDANGGAPAGAPAQQSFWRATQQGSGTQTLDFKPRNGDWRVVVMNSSASPHVAVHMKLGVKTKVLLWLGLGLIGFGVATAAGGVMLRLSRPKR